jgi:hypothetical protein
MMNTTVANSINEKLHDLKVFRIGAYSTTIAAIKMKYAGWNINAIVKIVPIMGTILFTR